MAITTKKVSHEYLGYVLIDWSQNLWDILEKDAAQPKPWPQDRAFPIRETRWQSGNSAAYTLAAIALAKITGEGLGAVMRGPEIHDISKPGNNPVRVLGGTFTKAVIFDPFYAWGAQVHRMYMQPRFDLLCECVEKVTTLHGHKAVLAAFPKNFAYRQAIANEIDRLGLEGPNKVITRLVRSLPEIIPNTILPDNIKVVIGKTPAALRNL